MPPRFPYGLGLSVARMSRTKEVKIRSAFRILPGRYRPNLSKKRLHLEPQNNMFSSNKFFLSAQNSIILKTMQIQNQNLAKRFLINVALIVLSITLLGCASRETEIIIPASPDKIWTVLIDTDGYKEWNPVFVPLKGRLEQVEEGEILTWLYTQRGQDPIETEMKVVKFVEHKQLNQQGGIWGILNVNHNWFLDPVPEGTRVTNREEWSGIGVLFWDYSWVEPTYKEMNENLKKQVLRTR